MAPAPSPLPTWATALEALGSASSPLISLLPTPRQGYSSKPPLLLTQISEYPSVLRRAARSRTSTDSPSLPPPTSPAPPPSDLPTPSWSTPMREGGGGGG